MFIDEASSGDILPRVRGAAEFEQSRYEADYTSLLAAIKRAFGNKMLMLNTAEYTKDFDRANAAAAGASPARLGAAAGVPEGEGAVGTAGFGSSRFSGATFSSSLSGASGERMSFRSTIAYTLREDR